MMKPLTQSPQKWAPCLTRWLDFVQLAHAQLLITLEMFDCKITK